MIKKGYGLIRLMRINQPIGIFLLLWPTLWGLWTASKGKPDWYIVMLFVVGAICMRSAGCVINDYIDSNIDGHVQRTNCRPLIDGTIKKKEALIIFLILVVISAGLVLSFNIITVVLAIVVLLLSIIYPFLKRYTYFPQLILGIIFSIPILMTFTVINQPINVVTGLLFIANTVWTISYDTEYAMMDRKDDQNISIKSSALFFGNLDRFIVGVLQGITVFIFVLIAWQAKLSLIFYMFAVLGVTILFIWQQVLIYHRSQRGCFKAFLNNNYVGLLVFVGILLHFYFVE